MFVGKARSLPLEDSPVRGSTLVVSSLVKNIKLGDKTWAEFLGVFDYAIQLHA
jgi:hypothetical protein